MKVKRYSIDLSEQMAVCDANYIRILRLLAGTPSSKKREMMLPSLGGSNLENSQILVTIELIEEFKYTTTIRLSQEICQDKGKFSASFDIDMPEMIVRMYHDANTAEVVSYQGHKNFKASYPLPNKNMYHADEKEQLNLFLSQWLQLCQKEGLHPGKNLSEEYLACLEIG